MCGQVFYERITNVDSMCNDSIQQTTIKALVYKPANQPPTDKGNILEIRLLGSPIECEKFLASLVTQIENEPGNSVPMVTLISENTTEIISPHLYDGAKKFSHDTQTQESGPTNSKE